MALVDIAHGKSRHVHYRDSKLTFLLRVCTIHSLAMFTLYTALNLMHVYLYTYILCYTRVPVQDSLGGNAKTHLVANVHPNAR